MKEVQCPKCLGYKVIYSPKEDNEIECNLCKGKGLVSDKINDTYDAVADMLNELTDDEDE